VRIFLIGPTLLGLIHFAGSFLFDDVRQVVHKRPASVYSNISTALSNTPKSGIMQLEDGSSVPYQFSVDRGPGEHLVVHMMFNGRKAGQLDLNFAPENGGEDTLIIAKVDSDGQVIREELAGTDKAKLGYAPDWLLNFAFGGSLREAAELIEKDSFAGVSSGGFGGGSLTAQEQKQRDEWLQYNASRPTTDPNAAADQYMGRK
jgi:hypothetical protein